MQFTTKEHEGTRRNTKKIRLMGPTEWLAFWDRRVALGHASDDAADAEYNSAIPAGSLDGA
jgi:hypothetical protein